MPGPATTGSTGPGSDPGPGPAPPRSSRAGDGHGGQQPAPGWGDHPHLPVRLRGRRGGRLDLRPQLVHVECGGSGVVVDLDDEPVGAVQLDSDPVDHPV